MSFIEGLRDESIAIIGAGVTGRALFQYLSDQGVTPVVVDEKVDEGQKFQTLATPPADITLAIVSPGWKSSHPIISALRNQKTTLLSEVDFAWRIKCEIAPDQKWIALTGTNGKTTTIQMINSIFDYSGISGVACGNVGIP
jgi:UDP-N-acetylmuramoylalanine--D-glutamate ligase